MSLGKELAMPAAVVIAGVAIACGLYFGLRAQVPVAPAVPVVAGAVPVVPSASVPARPVASVEEVTRQAVEALSYQRTMLRERCFRAALAGQPGLTMELTFNVTFDAEGQTIARGVVETPGSSTPALTACVGDAMLPLRVPPPGRTVQVEVPLRFP